MLQENSNEGETNLSRTTGFVLLGTFNEADRFGLCETSMSESSTSLLSDKFKAVIEKKTKKKRKMEIIKEYTVLLYREYFTILKIIRNCIIEIVSSQEK